MFSVGSSPALTTYGKTEGPAANQCWWSPPPEGVEILWALLKHLKCPKPLLQYAFVAGLSHSVFQTTSCLFDKASFTSCPTERKPLKTIEHELALTSMKTYENNWKHRHIRKNSTFNGVRLAILMKIETTIDSGDFFCWPEESDKIQVLDTQENIQVKPWKESKWCSGMQPRFWSRTSPTNAMWGASLFTQRSNSKCRVRSLPSIHQLSPRCLAVIMVFYIVFHVFPCVLSITHVLYRWLINTDHMHSIAFICYKLLWTEK